MDDFSKDPVGSLAKGFGFLSSSLQKNIGQVNEAYIKPNVKNFADSDLSSNARKAMMQFGQKMQETGRYGVETFNKFTADGEVGDINGDSFQGRTSNFPKEDNKIASLFDNLSSMEQQRTSSNRSGQGSYGANSNSSASGRKSPVEFEKDDHWDDWQD